MPHDGAAGVLPSADLMFLQGARTRTGGGINTARHARGGGGGGGGGHRVRLGLRGAPLVHVRTLHGDDNIATPPAERLVPGATYQWRVDAVAEGCNPADEEDTLEGAGCVVEGPVWSFSVGCEDVDCVDCAALPGSGACVTCAPGRTLLRGRCLYDGGCADGRWNVNVSSAARSFSPGACAAAAPGPPGASASADQTCRFLAIPGSYTDGFSVGSVLVAGCGLAGHKQANPNPNPVPNPNPNPNP